MGRPIDRTGQRYGRLVVLGQAGRSKQGQVLWRCLCDCGSECGANICNLKSGATQSCGCLRRETSGRARGIIDRTGQRHGRLVVMERAPNKGRKTVWRCLCDCGEECFVHGNSLTHGGTQSCGCLAAETTKARSTTHGLSHSKAYRAYMNAKARCQNPDHPRWPSYGGRGIQFLYPSVEALVADIGHPPSADLTIDRIDVNGHYEAGNCCWATRAEQANNRRSNRLLTYQGRTQTIAQWAREVGLRPETIWRRLDRNWPAERAISTPVKARQ